MRDCSGARRGIDLCHFVVLRFSPVSENAPIGQAVGMVLAAAANTTVFYSIVGGNEGGK